MIGIIEHKINQKLIIIDFSLPGYVLCYSETESSHGGTGFFVSNKLLFKQRSDLVINWKLENWNLLLLKSDSHVPENFCQSKIFPSHVRKNIMICLFGA